LRTNRSIRWIVRCGKLLPAVMLYQSIGCLPDNAFAEVFAENIVFTSALVIQSITSLIFNTIFFFRPV